MSRLASMHTTDEIYTALKVQRYKRFMRSRLSTSKNMTTCEYIKCLCGNPLTSKSTGDGLKC